MIFTSVMLHYNERLCDILLLFGKSSRPMHVDFYLMRNIYIYKAYWVSVSQLIRYARASSLYEDFITRSQLLTSKLLKQGFTRNIVDGLSDF